MLIFALFSDSMPETAPQVMQTITEHFDVSALAGMDTLAVSFLYLELDFRHGNRSGVVNLKGGP